MNDDIDSTGIDLNNLPSPLSASSDETLQISEKLKISAQSNTARSTGTGKMMRFKTITVGTNCDCKRLSKIFLPYLHYSFTVLWATVIIVHYRKTYHHCYWYPADVGKVVLLIF